MHNGKEAAITLVLLNSRSSRNYVPSKNRPYNGEAGVLSFEDDNACSPIIATL
jgi:hypothetical protein